MSKNSQHTQFTDGEVENPNAPTDTEDTANQDDGFESEEETNPDEGAEGSQDPENNGEIEEPTGEDDSGERRGESVDPRDEKISLLEKQLNEIKEKIGNPENKPEPEPQPRVYSEDEKMAISARFGGMPFEQLEPLNKMIMNNNQFVIKQIKDYVESQLGDIKKGSAIESFSKSPGFSDALKYRSGMEEYLAKQPPQLRATKESLEMAYHYARSTSMNKTIKTIRSNKDKNKRIVSSGRPSGGESPSRRSSSLSPEEIRMAKAAGMSVAEYAKYKQPLHMIK